MKKKIGVLFLVTVMLVCAQSFVLANGNSADTSIDSNYSAYSPEGILQPNGVYLLAGQSVILGGTGLVKVSGYTEAFSDVAEISIQLSVYRQNSSGGWDYVWSNSYTRYNTYRITTGNINVSVASGYNYKVKGVHTIRNGITETTYTESNAVYAY